MRADDGRVLPNFINQALAGRPLTVHGDGGQTRSFCYVDDLVDGLVRLMNSEISNPVNIGNPEEITILQAAREVIDLIGSRSEIAFVPRPADDPHIRRPDISRARSLLSWDATVSRRDGFAKTIEWFQSQVNI
jgi:dTDP-glucose 4,6-dehydratase